MKNSIGIIGLGYVGGRTLLKWFENRNLLKNFIEIG